MMNTIKQGTNERRHDGGALPKGQADNEMKEEKGHLCQKKKKKKDKKREKKREKASANAGGQPALFKPSKYRATRPLGGHSFL
jgi:hypothetical protein